MSENSDFPFQVFCSVKDVEKGLNEIRRVLKPGGAFLFFEHVIGPPGSGTRVIQSVLNPRKFFFKYPFLLEWISQCNNSSREVVI